MFLIEASAKAYINAVATGDLRKEYALLLETSSSNYVVSLP